MDNRYPGRVVTTIQPQHLGAYPGQEKSLAVAYILLVFFGWFGAHQFYLGKTGKGIGYMFTLAWFSVGWLVDLFTLPGQVKRANFERQTVRR